MAGNQTIHLLLLFLYIYIIFHTVGDFFNVNIKELERPEIPMLVFAYTYTYV